MGTQDVRVCGNIKFDMSPAPTLLAQGQAWSKASARPIVLAASTREGEEPGLLDAWMALRQSPAWPQLGDAPRLLIVPRHPQRFDEVAALITQTGMSLSRRSAWPEGQPDAAARQAEVWLGDSMGEMPAYYAAAHVALLGGELCAAGRAEPDRGRSLWLPRDHGASHFQFRRGGRVERGGGGCIPRAGCNDGCYEKCVIL